MLSLKPLPGTYTIHRFSPGTEIPVEALTGSFFALIGTEEETSLVVSSEVNLPSQASEPGWRGLQVVGPLDFSLIGILAGLASVLAAARISLFVISSFDTDTLLVKVENFSRACAKLAQAGYTILSEEP